MARLAIIGGGPKAAAVAAKADALRRAGYTPPDVVIYEPDALAAAWAGTSGYTDGLQPLCTLAERDLGYPYDRASFGPGTAHAMVANYSWQAFSVVEGVDDAEYDRWVMRGRRPPQHRDYANYLVSAIHRSGATHRQQTVTGLAYLGGGWRVTATDKSGVQSFDDYEGVVVTGSGPPLPALSGGNARVFDGKAFWLQRPQIVRMLQLDWDPSVVIIGAGGTAAAIAHWFVRQGISHIPITIIGREPTLYVRHPSPFEDRLFTDSVAWDALADHVKDAFVTRLTRGVVWDYVLRNLDAENLSYESFDAQQFVPLATPVPPGLPPALQVELHDPPGPAPGVPTRGVQRREAAVFIDARGFDAWWFVSGLMGSSFSHSHFSSRPAVLAGIDFSLAIGPMAAAGRSAFPPGLHVPMLGSRQGPAASNLMALGWMADRILSRYIPPAHVLRHGGSLAAPAGGT